MSTHKCPIHPQMSNHFLKGCYTFRNLPQAEKIDVMNSHGICHRCGHNNCVAGKHPFNYEDCQFIANCQIPTCGMNTQFSSICPRVYGLDGYNHFDRKYTRVDLLNADAENVLPSKSQPIYKNSNPAVQARIVSHVLCQPSWDIYVMVLRRRPKYGYSSTLEVRYR